MDSIRCKVLAFQACDRERFSDLSSAYICNHIMYISLYIYIHLENHNVFQGPNAWQKFRAFKFSICSLSHEGSMGVMKMKRRYPMSCCGIPEACESKQRNLTISLHQKQLLCQLEYNTFLVKTESAKNGESFPYHPCMIYLPTFTNIYLHSTFFYH